MFSLSIASMFSLSPAGDRAERQRIESKAENKALIPVLCSLRMAEGGLHGNDTRQTSYDSYMSCFQKPWLRRTSLPTPLL